MTAQDLDRLLHDCRQPQAWLARQIGVSEMTVSRWVRGERPIPPRRVPQVQAAFRPNGAEVR